MVWLFTFFAEREAGCDPLNEPEHSEVRCPGHPPGIKYPPGAECHIRCSKGHKLDGTHIRICGKDGRWSGDSMCIRKYCSNFLLQLGPGLHSLQSQ